MDDSVSPSATVEPAAASAAIPAPAPAAEPQGGEKRKAVANAEGKKKAKAEGKVEVKEEGKGGRRFTWTEPKELALFSVDFPFPFFFSFFSLCFFFCLHMIEITDFVNSLLRSNHLCHAFHTRRSISNWTSRSL